MARKPSYRVVAPDRYLAVAPAPGRVSVALDGAPVASSARALALTEGERPAAYYLPAEDVAPGAALERSERRYACRWKGDATYFHVRVGERLVDDGAWEYAEPPADLAPLAGHVAFDPEAFDVDASDGARTEAPGGSSDGAPHA